MSSNVLDANPCAAAMLRLLEAMGLTAAVVTSEVVALKTKPTTKTA